MNHCLKFYITKETIHIYGNFCSKEEYLIFRILNKKLHGIQKENFIFGVNNTKNRKVMKMMIDPEWLKELVKKEDELIAEYKQKWGDIRKYLGWECYEMGISWDDASILVQNHLAEITFISCKSRLYRLERKNIENYIKMYEMQSPNQQNYESLNDLFSSIIGYDDIKELLKSVIKQGERFGTLFVGPPASAKSMFLMELLRLPNSFFITAYTTTQVRLRDVFIYQNPKYIAVDEIDKASFETITTLLSALENGIVVKTTATDNIAVRVEPIIFASCNNINKIDAAIKSRFQIFRLKPYKIEELKLIGNMIFKKEGISEENIDKYVNMALEKGVIDDPRDFVKIAKLIKANPNNVENVLNIIAKYRW